MSYLPADIAQADQHYASVGAHLDALVDAHRDPPVDRVKALDFLVEMLADPARRDGTVLCPHRHAATLAGLLAVAIDRLAHR